MTTFSEDEKKKWKENEKENKNNRLLCTVYGRTCTDRSKSQERCFSLHCNFRMDDKNKYIVGYLSLRRVWAQKILNAPHSPHTAEYALKLKTECATPEKKQSHFAKYVLMMPANLSSTRCSETKSMPWCCGKVAAAVAWNALQYCIKIYLFRLDLRAIYMDHLALPLMPKINMKTKYIYNIYIYEKKKCLFILFDVQVSRHTIYMHNHFSNWKLATPNYERSK